MGSIKIAHFSNLYLYYHFEDLEVPENVGESLSNTTKVRFVNTFEDLNDKDIDAIIFSGNTLYKDNLLPKDLMEFNSILSKFKGKVFIVPGDTDPYSLYSKFKFSENVFIFKDNQISKFNIKDDIYLYGIGGNLTSQNLIDSISISHSSINIFCFFSSNLLPDEINFTDNFDYMAAGGFPEYFNKKNLYYPGSFSHIKWNEGNGSYLISYISNNNISVSQIPSNVPKLNAVTVNFSKKVDTKQYLRSALSSDEYKDSVLKVYLEGKNFEFVNIDVLKEHFSSDFIYLEILNNLVPDKRSLKKIESSFYDLVDDRKLIYRGIEFLRGKGDY